MARAGLTGAAEDPQWVRGAKDSDLRTKKRRPEKIGRNAPSKTWPPLNVHVPKPQFVPHTMFSRFHCKRFVNQLTYTVLLYSNVFYGSLPVGTAISSCTGIGSLPVGSATSGLLPRDRASERHTGPG